jgi:hypothetical protein
LQGNARTSRPWSQGLMISARHVIERFDHTRCLNQMTTHDVAGTDPTV